MNAKLFVRLVTLATVLLLSLAGCRQAEDDTSSNTLEADAYLGVAEIYREQGQFRAGIIEAQNALQAFPEYDRTRRFISRLYLDMGNTVEAQSVLESLLSANPDDGAATLLLAETYLNAGNQDGALETLENFQGTTDEERVQALWIEGNAHARNTNEAATQEAFNSALEINPAHVPTLVNLSMLEFQTGNEFGAQQYLDTAIEADPSDLDLLIWRGQFALLQENYAESEEAFFDALQIMGEYDTMTPKRMAVLRAIILPLQMQQKDEEALRYSQIIAETPQGQLQNSFSSALTLFQEGNFADAQIAIDSVLSEAPDHAGSNILLGLTQYAQGNFQGAEASLSGLVNAESSSPDVIKVLAATHLRLGQAERALSVLEEAIALYPEDGSLLAMVGISQQTLGNVEGSIESFERAIELQTESPDLHFALAGSYFRNEQSDAAIEQIERTLDLNPDYNGAKTTLIDLLLAAERVDEARAFIETWIAEDSNSVVNNNVAGRLEFRQSNLDSARNYFNNSINTDPTNAEARLFLARIAMQENDYDAAQTQFEEVISAEPSNLEALSGFLALGDLSDTATAKIAEVNRIIETVPTEFAPALVLAQYHITKGDFDSALPPAETAYGRNTNDFTANTLLEIVIQLTAQARRDEDIDRARELAAYTLELQPENLQVLLLAAGVEAQGEDFAAALSYIERIKELQPEGSSLGIELEGDLAVQQAEFENGLAAYLQAWAISGASNPGLGVKIHRTLAGLERDDDALAFLNDWVALAPEEPAANLLLGMSLQENSQDGEAIEAYEIAYTSEPDNIVTLNNLAWLYQDSSPERALELATRAAELYPENADVLDTYGWILLKQDERDHAIQVLERALELAPESVAIEQHLQEARQ